MCIFFFGLKGVGSILGWKCWYPKLVFFQILTPFLDYVYIKTLIFIWHIIISVQIELSPRPNEQPILWIVFLMFYFKLEYIYKASGLDTLYASSIFSGRTGGYPRKLHKEDERMGSSAGTFLCILHLTSFYSFQIGGHIQKHSK